MESHIIILKAIRWTSSWKRNTFISSTICALHLDIDRNVFQFIDIGSIVPFKCYIFLSLSILSIYHHIYTLFYIFIVSTASWCNPRLRKVSNELMSKIRDWWNTERNHETFENFSCFIVTTGLLYPATHIVKLLRNDFRVKIRFILLLLVQNSPIKDLFLKSHELLSLSSSFFLLGMTHG